MIKDKSIYRRGFTLIELLVVIAIIGILASIILASLGSARGKAIDTRRLSDMKQIETDLEYYYDDNKAYPVCSSGWCTQCTTWSGPAGDVLASMLVPKYIPKEPSDTETNGVSQNCYLYHTDASGQNYKYMEFNLLTANVSSQKTFIDPKSNATYWSNLGQTPCPSPRGSAAWAIWNSSVSQCY